MGAVLKWHTEIRRGIPLEVTSEDIIRLKKAGYIKEGEWLR